MDYFKYLKRFRTAKKLVNLPCDEGILREVLNQDSHYVFVQSYVLGGKVEVANYNCLSKLKVGQVVPLKNIQGVSLNTKLAYITPLHYGIGRCDKRANKF